MISRDALISRAWQALTADRYLPLVAPALPHTLAWLWDLSGLVLDNAARVRSLHAAGLQQWVGRWASLESKGTARPMGDVMVLCDEMKLWDMEGLQVPVSAELDKHARLHLAAAAHVALETMAQAVCAADAFPPGLQELLRRTVEADAAAAVERVKAETDTGVFRDVLGQRRLVAGTFREAVVLFLQGSGVAEPEDLARTLIAAEARAHAPAEEGIGS